jgi:hypothetical protein
MCRTKKLDGKINKNLKIYIDCNIPSYHPNPENLGGSCHRSGGESVLFWAHPMLLFQLAGQWNLKVVGKFGGRLGSGIAMCALSPGGATAVMHLARTWS